MVKYTRRFTAPLVMSLALIAAACAKKDDTVATDTTLNRDLALAGDTAAQPQLTDVPAPAAAPASAPASAAPTKAAPRATPSRTTTRTPARTGGSSSGSAPAASARSVSSGTQLTFANAGETVCTNTKGVGDTFTMQLSDPAGGASSGSATFRVTESTGAKNAGERPVLSLAVVSMTLDGRTRSPSTSVAANVDVSIDEAKGNTAKNVGGGAAIGAIAGRVLGGSGKATAAGAAVGAAAGAARAAQTSDRKGCLRNAVVTLNEGFTL